MSVRPSRVRGGEWIIGAASLVLGVVLFALPWYGRSVAVVGPRAPVRRHVGSTLTEPVTANGWHSLVVLGPLTLVVAVLGVLAWWLQATRGAPALPICCVVAEWFLAIVLFIGLVIRVLVDPPTGWLAGGGGAPTIETKAGAYLAFALTAAIVLGAYRSMRQDGIAARDAPVRIETVRLTRQVAAPNR